MPCRWRVSFNVDIPGTAMFLRRQNPFSSIQRLLRSSGLRPSPPSSTTTPPLTRAMMPPMPRRSTCSRNLHNAGVARVFAPIPSRPDQYSLRMDDGMTFTQGCPTSTKKIDCSIPANIWVLVTKPPTSLLSWIHQEPVELPEQMLPLTVAILNRLGFKPASPAPGDYLPDNH
jgi:hypothetical protein